MPDEHYTWLRKWGEMLRLDRSFINAQVELAAEDGAPPDAIYKRLDGSWATIEHIRSDWCRAQMGLPVGVS